MRLQLHQRDCFHLNMFLINTSTCNLRKRVIILLDKIPFTFRVNWAEHGTRSTPFKSRAYSSYIMNLLNHILPDRTFVHLGIGPAFDPYHLIGISAGIIALRDPFAPLLANEYLVIQFAFTICNTA